MPALETQPVWNRGQCPVNPPSHTWAEDGGESPGVSAGFQATDTNPYSDLSSSTPTATVEVFSLRLDPERWPRRLVLSSCQEGCLPFWPWDQRVGRPEWRGMGEHGWPPGATGWPPLGCVLGETEASAKSSLGSGHFSVSGFLLGHCSFDVSDPISSALALVLVTWKCFCSEDSLYD